MCRASMHAMHCMRLRSHSESVHQYWLLRYICACFAAQHVNLKICCLDMAMDCCQSSKHPVPELWTRIPAHLDSNASPQLG